MNLQVCINQLLCSSGHFPGWIWNSLHDWNQNKTDRQTDKEYHACLIGFLQRLTWESIVFCYTSFNSTDEKSVWSSNFSLISGLLLVSVISFTLFPLHLSFLTSFCLECFCFCKVSQFRSFPFLMSHVNHENHDLMTSCLVSRFSWQLFCLLFCWRRKKGNRLSFYFKLKMKIISRIKPLMAPVKEIGREKMKKKLRKKVLLNQKRWKLKPILFSLPVVFLFPFKVKVEGWLQSILLFFILPFSGSFHDESQNQKRWVFSLFFQTSSPDMFCLDDIRGNWETERS